MLFWRTLQNGPNRKADAEFRGKKMATNGRTLHKGFKQGRSAELTQFYAGISVVYSAGSVQNELFCRVDRFSEGFRKMNSARYPKKDPICRVHGAARFCRTVGGVDTYKRL